jgi:hypothetical protein
MISYQRSRIDATGHSPSERPQCDKVLRWHVPPFRKDVGETSRAQTRDQGPYDLDRVLGFEQRRGRSAAVNPETGKDSVQTHQELHDSDGIRDKDDLGRGRVLTKN